jgi:hypothetical protein
MRRVIPVFCYTVTIAVVFGLLVNTSLGPIRNKQATAIEQNFLNDSIENLSQQKIKLEDLKFKINKLQFEYYNLPYIPFETKLQSLTNSDNYSTRYNKALTRFRKNVEIIGNEVRGDTNLHYKNLNFRIGDMLQMMDNFSYSNLNIAENTQRELREQDSIFEYNQDKIEDLFSSLMDFVNEAHYRILEESNILNVPEHFFDKLSGYSYFTSDMDSCKAKLSELLKYYAESKISSQQNKRMNKTLLYTKFPLTFLNCQNKKILNLKSFLLQISISIALGVIGQLIISDRTATEAL